jgi:hypothetical protein
MASSVTLGSNYPSRGPEVSSRNVESEHLGSDLRTRRPAGAGSPRPRDRHPDPRPVRDGSLSWRISGARDLVTGGRTALHGPPIGSECALDAPSTPGRPRHSQTTAGRHRQSGGRRQNSHMRFRPQLAIWLIPPGEPTVSVIVASPLRSKRSPSLLLTVEKKRVWHEDLRSASKAVGQPCTGSQSFAKYPSCRPAA